MNYRHAFHVGNFADCTKHALLVWLLHALRRKPAPFTVLDTHAGIGAYDLTAGPAERTGEWRAGIALLLDDPPPELADYVGLVRDFGAGYPGSPALTRALLRGEDRLICCELHPEDAHTLRQFFARDPLVAVHQRDGWEAVAALTPPSGRRGLVLIDPPYEAPDEHARLVEALRDGLARNPHAILAAWYPVKHRAPVRALHHAIQQAGLHDAVCAELWLREPTDPTRLNGNGLVVINPPYRFEAEVPAILAALLDRLGTREAGEGTAMLRLTDE
jgi:23S rRNA (adenine2030-N6)-methyltransferase